MNRKQLIILIVLLAVLGGAVMLIQNHRTTDENTGAKEEGGKLLGNKFPINDVAAIEIKQGTNDLNLVKQNDRWSVAERANYPADFSKITSFLVKAADLKILETEQVDATDLPKLQLATTGDTGLGTVLTMKDKDGKTIKAITVGKPHVPKSTGKSPFGEDESFPDGRYVMLAGDTHDAYLLHDPLSEVEPKADQWLNKDFFKIERPKAVAVSYPEPDASNSWSIVRDTETGDWKVADLKTNQTENTTNLPSVTSPLSAASFDDVMAPTTKPEETGLDKPTTLTVDTFDDFTYTVKIGKKNGDNYPITMSVVANFPKERAPAAGEKPEDKEKADKAWTERQKQLEATLKQNQAYQNWIYMVAGWSLDSILKHRDELVMEKPVEIKAGVSTNSASTDNGATPVATPDPMGNK
jgi:Domain of unknown function (DUF4340)